MSTDLAGPPPEWEVGLSTYFQEFYERGRRQFVDHPRRTLDAAASMNRLPMLDADLPDSAEGHAIRESLSRVSSRLRWFLRYRNVVDVLPIPTDSAAYMVGPHRQTLRRKVRQAEKAGISWHAEDSADARQSLLKSAADWERLHPLKVYRRNVPQLTDLVDYRLWLVAESPEGEPILLAVIPVSGEWALLRYFRILGEGEHQSLARYLMMKVLVDELSRRGVRYLANSDLPFAIPPGLRHFQRMLGWRLARLRFTDR